jgi:hypothetical protein
VTVQKIWVISLIIFLVIGFGAIGRSLFNQLACEGQPINFRITPTAEQQIWGERSVSQSFVAPRNGLNRIDLLLHTYQRQNSRDVSLSLWELSSTDNLTQGQKVVDLNFNAATVQDGNWRTFTFAPIAESAGKPYLIVLQSPESTPGDAITVGGIEWDSYAPGAAFLGTTPLRADISFRACYQMGALEKIQVLSQQISRHRPVWWGQPLFYGTLIVVYALLLAGLFWQLTKLAL